MSSDLDEVFGPGEDRVIEVTIFVPSADRNGNPIRDQLAWREKAIHLLADLYGAATALGPAVGVWKNPRTGQLIRDEPILVYAYVSERDVYDLRKLARLKDFCINMGTKTRQGEVMLKIGDRLYYIETW